MSKLIQTAKDFIGECWHGKFNESCIFDTLSKNCLHQKTIGKGIGIESFLSDCNDWTAAFPDFSTEIKDIQEYRNVVICNIARAGTHLYRYQSTNKDRKTILTASDFFSGIENAPPTGNRYQQPAKVILAFEKGKISQVTIDEDPTAISRQLGLGTEKNPSNRDYLSDISLLTKTLNRSLITPLSSREIECLALGFCGFSAKHIGEILGISYRTIETHMIHIYRKLDCFGKQQVLEFMYEKQLLTLWLDLGKSLLIYYKSK